MRELPEIYNNINPNKKYNASVSSSQASLVDHLSNIASARDLANKGQEKMQKLCLNRAIKNK